MQAKLQRRRQELTQATPDPPVDDEALYYNVAANVPKDVSTRQFGMTMDGAGLSHPPPPPHEQQQAQINPIDPPQQQDNVDREMQDWLTRYEQLGDT
ncbi:hypothetical protein Scep_018805 [Stephania cephalantha]|uniref:Uncharacterized protein n=1 Tax=Stephania cephalantha TaxID=152367 RepID=A0AAP0IAN1_9MAGN